VGKIKDVSDAPFSQEYPCDCMLSAVANASFYPSSPYSWLKGRLKIDRVWLSHEEMCKMFSGVLVIHEFPAK
jgi:hypothetical protein